MAVYQREERLRLEVVGVWDQVFVHLRACQAASGLRCVITFTY